ncbi:hypothetical protein MBLNU230_g0158t1 [Neophaeotheca triangularis]
MSTMDTPIWLDCDTGHDDCFGLLLAAHHPSSRLLGVSTVYGNAPLKHTTRNTLSILAAIQRPSTPIYPGASKPLCRAAASAADIHGDSGLDGTTLLPTPQVSERRDKPAVVAMAEAIAATEKGKTWIVATGCLTNVALLFSVYPELSHHIAGLSIMGGAIGGGFTDAPMGEVEGEGERFGNWTPWAEFNIYLDPEAARCVFDNPILSAKTTLIPLDLTHQFLATPAVQQLLLRGPKANLSFDQPSEVRRLFMEILTFFAGTYASVFGITAGPPLHDPLAVFAAIAPGLLDDSGGERYNVDVVLEGEHGSSAHVRSGVSQCGRTIATRLSHGLPGVRIPRALQTEELWAIIEKCLASAEDAGKNA